MTRAHLITDEMASQKWCPFSRVIVEIVDVNTKNMVSSTTGNRLETVEDGILSGALCVGSNCMAWRTGSGLADRAAGRGFCGLTGNGET